MSCRNSDHWFGGMLARGVVVVAVAFGATANLLAQSELGVVTALSGTGQYRGAQALRIGQALDSTDTIETGPNSVAGVFITSDPSRAGFAGFSGEIVIEVDAETKVTLTKEQRTGAPVYVEVERGRARAFFDPGRFKEMVVLKTPLGEMQVTGSIIWVSHRKQGGSIFASEDSNAEIRLQAGARRRIPISRGQKVVVKPGAEPAVEPLIDADLKSWDVVQRMWLPRAQLAARRVTLARTQWDNEKKEFELPEEPGRYRALEENVQGQVSNLQALGVSQAAQIATVSASVVPAQPAVRGRGAAR